MLLEQDTSPRVRANMLLYLFEDVRRKSCIERGNKLSKSTLYLMMLEYMKVQLSH